MKDIIPFGKYKDKPIDVLAQDKEYVEWLLKTTWFKQRYGYIYNIVINNFQTPSDTPEHNKIQIKFLDNSYRLKFAFKALGEKLFYWNASKIDEKWNEILLDLADYYSWQYDTEVEFINKTVPLDKSSMKYHYWPSIVKKPIDNLKPNEDISKYLEEKDEFIHRKITQLIGKFDKNIYKLLSITDIDFENKKTAADVSFSVVYGCLGCEPIWEIRDKLNKHYGALKNSHNFIIEIKHQVFDDYPSILRQMKQNNARYLFISEYMGSGASLEQFEKFFESQGIKVIFEFDVDSCVLPAIDEEYCFSVLDKIKKIVNTKASEDGSVKWNIKYKGREWTEKESKDRIKTLPSKLTINNGMLLNNENERMQLLNMLMENMGLEKTLKVVTKDLLRQYVLENKICEIET